MSNHADVLPEPATCAGPPVIHLRLDYNVISATTSGIVDDAVCQAIDVIFATIIPQSGVTELAGEACGYVSRMERYVHWRHFRVVLLFHFEPNYTEPRA